MPVPGLAWPTLLSPLPGSEELQPMTAEARSSSCIWISIMQFISALVLSSKARTSCHWADPGGPQDAPPHPGPLCHWRAPHCKPPSSTSLGWPALPTLALTPGGSQPVD